MRDALDQAAGDEASTAGKRVVSLIEELRMVLTCLMSANPLGMQSLRCALSSMCSYLLVPAAPEASQQLPRVGTINGQSCTCLLCSSYPSSSLSREACVLCMSILIAFTCALWTLWIPVAPSTVYPIQQSQRCTA